MQASCESVPGVVVAGLRGGSGKTIISLGITAAWKRMNTAVSPFKKGPDYIDAGWLSLAAGRPCYNLDTYLCNPAVVQQSYLTHSQSCDIALVEGNRGLYDGIDTDGSTSTAELAKLLHLPVVLVLDCTKSTRTMAALLLGCMHFDPQVRILGVILNQVAGKRHRKKVAANIERFCNIPVFGAVPKLGSDDFPERHMGLVTSAEHGSSQNSLAAVAKMAMDHIDLTALYRAIIDDCTTCGKQRIPVADQPLLTGRKPKVPAVSFPIKNQQPQDQVVIGVIKDSAFQFYYPDNLEWFGLSIKPQGHGYTRVHVKNENPFYRIGDVLKGHEFRYSKILKIDFQDHEMAFTMERGKGILDKKDGFFKNNTFGTYTHIHALGSVSWAPSLVANARTYKARRLP
ncbi:MAG: cobyrinate a,c-diamide synthase [Desulfobacteraceae bacterium]|nr:cobyrinate a,c-diamide synthase [Desulfobacteraceae bacterium]